MKKFGTPKGAGPGNANENDGFDGVGTPPAPFAGGGFAGDFGLELLGFLAAGFFVVDFDLDFDLPAEPLLWLGAVEELLCRVGC
jgi:hypothetical protein